MMMRRPMQSLILLLFMAGFQGCGSQKEEPAPVAVTPTPIAATTTPTPEPTPLPPREIDLGEGMAGVIRQHGEGPEAAEGQTVTVDVFIGDENEEEVWSGKFEFVIGSGMAFPGMDRAVRGMKRGEQRVVSIPKALGIEGHEDLVLTVMLLEVKDEE